MGIKAGRAQGIRMPPARVQSSLMEKERVRATMGHNAEDNERELCPVIICNLDFIIARCLIDPATATVARAGLRGSLGGECLRNFPLWKSVLSSVCRRMRWDERLIDRYRN